MKPDPHTSEVAELENRLTHSKFLASSSHRSRTIPGVKDIKTTVLEVCNIALRELGPSDFGNGRDLRIRVAEPFRPGTVARMRTRRAFHPIDSPPEPT